MKLTISKGANPNYLAKIVKIETFRPHPKADRLKLTTVDGCTISVNINTEPGIFIYFPLECQIAHSYLSENNLYRDHSLNVTNDPTNVGFFEENRRVKCINLRGLSSEGLVMPISSLHPSFTRNVDVLRSECEKLIGTEFDTIDDNLFVQKYVPKTRRTPGIPGSRKDRRTQKKILNIADGQFRFHDDTEMLKKNVWKISPTDYIQVSHKFHGTSAIFCNLLVRKKKTLYQKFLNIFGVDNYGLEYKIFCSSRKVVKDPNINKGLQQGYYNVDIWNLALDVMKPHLKKGMSIYAEIVGYLPNGQMIQKDYDYWCQYKPEIHDYSQMTGQQMYDHNLFKIYVYRITSTNVDGQVVEFSARHLQDYCNSVGLVPVIEDYYGQVVDLVQDHFPDKLCAQDFEDYQDRLIEILSKDLEVKCPYCVNKVPREGFVIRVDKSKFEAYKLKSMKFYQRETAELDEGILNIEDSQS